MSANPLKSRQMALYWFFLREFYRSRAFAVMLTLIAGVAVIVTFLTLYEYKLIIPFMAPTPTTFSHISPQLRALLLNYIWSYIGVLIPPLAASFYSSPAISGDFESGAIIPLMSIPVSKGNLLFSKMFASFTAIALSMTLYEVIQLVIVNVIVPGSSLTLFSISFVLMLLFIFSCNSLAFAIGSFFKRSSHSTIVYLMVFYIVFNIISITLLLGFNSTPLYILNNAGGIVDRVFVDLNPVLFFSGGSISGANTAEILYSVEVMLFYSLLLTLISYLEFTRSRREI